MWGICGQNGRISGGLEGQANRQPPFFRRRLVWKLYTCILQPCFQSTVISFTPFPNKTHEHFVLNKWSSIFGLTYFSKISTSVQTFPESACLTAGPSLWINFYIYIWVASFSFTVLNILSKMLTGMTKIIWWLNLDVLWLSLELNMSKPEATQKCACPKGWENLQWGCRNLWKSAEIYIWPAILSRTSVFWNWNLNYTAHMYLENAQIYQHLPQTQQQLHKMENTQPQKENHWKHDAARTSHSSLYNNECLHAVFHALVCCMYCWQQRQIGQSWAVWDCAVGLVPCKAGNPAFCQLYPAEQRFSFRACSHQCSKTRANFRLSFSVYQINIFLSKWQKGSSALPVLKFHK